MVVVNSWVITPPNMGSMYIVSLLVTLLELTTHEPPSRGFKTWSKVLAVV